MKFEVYNKIAWFSTPQRLDDDAEAASITMIPA